MSDITLRKVATKLKRVASGFGSKARAKTKASKIQSYKNAIKKDAFATSTGKSEAKAQLAKLQK